MEQVIKARRILMESCGQLDFPSNLVDKIKPGVAVHIGRREGKTKALLWAIYEREQGKAILVALNGPVQRKLMDEWEKLVQEEKLFPVQMPEIIMAPGSPAFLQGRSEPVYCDEWFQFLPEVQKGLRDSGRVRGAVGTRSQGSSEVEVFPL